MQELLLFLGEQSLRQPGKPLREQDIGIEVFGRPANYDTTQDTLVRVQASQLRKKLQQYFDGEGRDEESVIELAKGSYALRFRPRDEPEPIQLVPRERPYYRRLPFLLAVSLAAAFAVICIALAFQNWRLRRIAEHGLGRQPAVNRLWRNMFGNGLPTHLVLADGNLLVFQDTIKQMIGIPDYHSRGFERLALERIPDPAQRALVLKAVSRQFTGIGDAELTRRITLVCATNEISLDVSLARAATIAQMNQHNIILTGSRRSNPWVGVFEDQLNFKTVFEEEPRLACFVNRSPRQGEQPRYCGVWSHLMYCRVAYLPNAKRTGHVLLISGTDLQSTEAGGELVTSDVWIPKLRHALGLREAEEMPHFEALLEGKELNNTAPQFELIAVRRR